MILVRIKQYITSKIANRFPIPQDEHAYLSNYEKNKQFSQNDWASSFDTVFTILKSFRNIQHFNHHFLFIKTNFMLVLFVFFFFFVKSKIIVVVLCSFVQINQNDFAQITGTISFGRRKAFNSLFFFLHKRYVFPLYFFAPFALPLYLRRQLFIYPSILPSFFPLSHTHSTFCPAVQGV